MEFVRNIEDVCMMDGREPFKCTGSIKVVKQAGKSIYASWSMQDENCETVAGRSRSYFCKEEPVEEEKMLISVLQNIINYRVERQRIFSYVMVTPSAHSHNT